MNRLTIAVDDADLTANARRELRAVTGIPVDAWDMPEVPS